MDQQDHRLRVTLADLQAVAGSRTRSRVAVELVDAINKYAPIYGINTRERLSLFFVHGSVETGGFRRLFSRRHCADFCASDVRRLFRYVRSANRLILLEKRGCAGSPVRTGLRSDFPVLPGKYREIRPFGRVSADLGRCKLLSSQTRFGEFPLDPNREF